MSNVTPPTIWNRPVRGSRGPEGELTRDQIAAVAIRLADAADLRAVTMRAVASSLGTSAGGLYRYVRGRDELIALMVDAALADLHVPAPGGDWEEQLVDVAREQLRVYGDHPWLVTAGFRPGPAGPNALRYFDRCLAILADVPASSATKMEGLAMVTGVVTLFARPARGDGVDPSTIFSAIDRAAHPHLAAALAAADPGPAQPDLFGRTVRSLLRGMFTTGSAV